ncbi:MAG TPA: FtsW/RodA/SpoVE family cell cycle protein [Rhizomicrobium sp.]|nr:FtsW/RodA/SpoVE family cell cycle protein [Rhizomicrobium sp.]
MSATAKRSGTADWWRSTDPVALVAMLALITLGLVLAFAASPAATGGPMTEGDFRYAAKQIAFAGIAVMILSVTSVLPLRTIKISATFIYIAAVIGSAIALFAGHEAFGAKRSIELGLLTLQPSEFLKPSFAVLAAAVLADNEKLIVRKEIAALIIAAPALLILLKQPDVGQTALLLALWGALLFFNGISIRWIGLLAGASAGLAGIAYLLFPHVHHRIDQYFDPHQIPYQTGLALKAFAHGGLAGVGPGAGTVKYHLPEAHSDFIFAVAGEEFGVLLCGAIVILFCLLCVRLLLRSARMSDAFSKLAGAGLAVVVALQAFINMGVAVSLLPTKGMTLPFISYGGSSLFAVALTMGFALAVTRQRSKIGESDCDLFGFLREARA